MCQYVFCFVVGDGEYQFVFIGEVQGVQIKQFVDVVYCVVDWQCCFLQFDVVVVGGGEFMGDCVNFVVGGVVQGFYFVQWVQGLDKWCQYCVVVGQCVVQFYLFVQVKDGGVMIFQCVVDQQYIIGVNLLCFLVNVCWDGVDVGGVNKQFICCVVWYYFSVVGDDGDFCCLGGVGYVGDYCFQGGYFQFFFENKVVGKIVWDGVVDCYIVGGIVDGQFVDIVVGKEQWVNYVVVGGEGEVVFLGGECCQIEVCLIFLFCQLGVGEGLYKQVVDQLLYCLFFVIVG